MAQRRFRFGAVCEHAMPRREWADTARGIEDAGFSTLLVPDHFDDRFAPLPALVAAADATTTLRVGTLVLDNDYRHPVVLAKEAATVDVLTNGRFELGIGAGWEQRDYDWSGIFGQTPDTVLESPHILIGSVDEIVEQVQQRREVFGISYLAFALDTYQPLMPVVTRLAAN